MVRRHCEDRSHKGLAHLSHLCAVVLQERLVPNAPVGVEIGIASEPLVGVIVLPAVVVLEARLIGKGQKTHAAAVGTMEEGRLIAPLREVSGNARIGVHACRREHKGLYELRNTAQHRGHTIYALTPVAVRIIPHGALLDELIHVRREAFILASEVHRVESAYILAPEALYDDDYHVLLHGFMLRLGMADGVEHGCCRFHVGIIIRHGKHALAYRAQHGERRVEHQCAVGRACYVLVGVVDGDGSDARLQSTAASSHAQRCGSGQASQLYEAVLHAALGCRIVCLVGAGHHVEFVKGKDYHGRNNHQIPVVNEFGAHDVAQVALVVKLLKHAGGCSSERVREVNGVGQIGYEGQTVDCYEEPAAYLMV